MQNKQRFSLILPVDITYLSAVKSYIAELAKTVHLKDKEIKLLNIGVEEAVTNVVEHAFLPEENKTFEVACEITTLEFKVIVKDKGLPFSPEAVEAFSPTKDSEGLQKSGLGFRLMKGCVDQLSFYNKGRGGKEVHLIKHLKHKHIDEYIASSEMQAYREPKSKVEDKISKTPFHIEFLTPKYAIEISQCAYRTYGYSYLMENIYYPKRLIGMAESGELISALAIRDGEPMVMAHVALERFGYKQNIPEVGMAFTIPEFRGQGCMKRITSAMLEKAKSLHIKGVFAKGVTTHPYSQKALIKNGFKSSGILIGISPPKHFKKIKSSQSQRESLVIFYKSLDKTNPPSIYIPSHHQAMINKIYRNLAFEIDINIHSKPTHSSELLQSELVLDLKELNHLANIFVFNPSTHFIEEIKQKLENLCQKKIETINIYLDLCNVDISEYVEGLEEIGFFFAGILPANERQFLILQFLNHIPIDYNKIVTASEFTKELLAYVKQQDVSKI